jgi:hypothetical protein
MDDLHSWPERIADREGDYLTPDDLQDLIRYSLSFQERLELYQVLQQQELTWIQKVLQQQGPTPVATALPSSNPAREGAEPSLTPAQRLLARQLAFCLRSLGLSLLLGDPTPLQQGTLGAMEQYLGLPQALDQLGAVVQGSLSADQHGNCLPPTGNYKLSAQLLRPNLLPLLLLRWRLTCPQFRRRGLSPWRKCLCEAH